MTSRNKQKRTTILEKQLSSFLVNNPYSSVNSFGKNRFISKPWNDDSLILPFVPKTKRKLVNALNKLILPPIFSAIYHVDTNTMEYIYTRLKPDDPILSRKFTFSLDNEQYLCQYNDASEELMIIENNYMRAENSPTDYRNLIYLEASTSVEESIITQRVPISFFVSGFQRYDELKILEVSKYLNFFMRYYDRNTPFILTHSTKENTLNLPILEYVEERFPNSITTQSKDSLLMDFMSAACDVGPRLQFIYCYQLIEYAAFYYVEENTRKELLNILNTPNIHSNHDSYLSRVFETMAELRMDDETKLSKLISTRCRPEVIYREIEHNRAYYSNQQEFEGGFSLDPLISENDTLETFRPMWFTKVATDLRYIRNALVHGREKKFGKVINPTIKNDYLIRPWCSVARRIAEEIVIFS